MDTIKLEYIELAFLLVEYYDALRNENRFQESDRLRYYLNTIEFRLINTKEYHSKFDCYSSRIYRNLEVEANKE